MGQLTIITALAALVSLSTSCVPLAIGAAGGYILNEEGYKVQSPVTKKDVSHGHPHSDINHNTSSYNPYGYAAAPHETATTNY